MAAPLADCDRYLDTGDVDLGREFVGYRQAALNLSDAELVEPLSDLRAVLAPRLDLPPAPGRRRRAMTTILMPADRRPARPVDGVE